ncbi:MAG: hypothetical protein ACYDAC_08195 [Candidatus Dormibacteria bacterium]
MAPLKTCPRCRGERLAVVYFGADDEPVGGHLQCPECGPRHSEELEVPQDVRRSDLLERKAS